MFHVKTRISIKDCKESTRASRGNLSQSEKHLREAAIAAFVGLTVVPLSTGLCPSCSHAWKYRDSSIYADWIKTQCFNTDMIIKVIYTFLTGHLVFFIYMILYIFPWYHIAVLLTNSKWNTVDYITE